MNDRTKALIRELFSAEMNEFRRSHPDVDAWDEEVKLTRFGLWLQERYASTPEDQSRLEEDRALARRNLLLE